MKKSKPNDEVEAIAMAFAWKTHGLLPAAESPQELWRACDGLARRQYRAHAKRFLRALRVSK
jgi:hypothetical protein